MSDDVQPAESSSPDAPEGGGEDTGQGAVDSSGGLYDLSSVPEDLRQFVEPHLKAMEANVTKRFQQNKEAMDAWGPYDELGIQDVDPAQLQQLLQFAEIAQDEDQFAEWWQAVGDRMGLFPEADESDAEVDDDLFADDLTPEQIKQMVSEAVAENVDPLYERFEEGEQERVEQEALSEIQEQLAEIKSEHGDDVDTDAILRLAWAYTDEDPDNAIARGLDDYLKLTGKGASDLFADKVSGGQPPEGPGAADTRPTPITTFPEAKEAARARLRAANS